MAHSDSFLSHFDVSASALTTERLKMRLAANNIANVNTTRTLEGGPYRRMEALVRSRLLNSCDTGGPAIDHGVSVEKVQIDSTPPKLIYDPSHPDANEQGYVAYPNIDIVSETAKLKQASLAYEANATVIETMKKSLALALDLAK